MSMLLEDERCLYYHTDCPLHDVLTHYQMWCHIKIYSLNPSVNVNCNTILTLHYGYTHTLIQR